jgi:hypothetical protein
MNLPEDTHPFRMPEGVDDYLANGTTPEAQVVAEADSCIGDPESYERALARQATRDRTPRVMATKDGRPLMSVLAEALGMEQED